MLVTMNVRDLVGEICISVIHTLNGEGLLLLYQFRSNLEFRLPFFAGI